MLVGPSNERKGVWRFGQGSKTWEATRGSGPRDAGEGGWAHREGASSQSIAARVPVARVLIFLLSVPRARTCRAVGIARSAFIEAEEGEGGERDADTRWRIWRSGDSP
jgi:hypothetical protein